MNPYPVKNFHEGGCGWCRVGGDVSGVGSGVGEQRSLFSTFVIFVTVC